MKKLGDKKEGVSCLLDTVIERIPPPKITKGDKVQMLISMTEANQFYG